MKYINRSMMIGTCINVLTSISTMDDGKATEKETASAMAAIATVLDALTEIPSVELPDGSDEGETEVLQ